jgi:hypothetical protein
MWQDEHSAHLAASFCRFSLLSCAAQNLGGTASAADAAAAETAGFFIVTELGPEYTPTAEAEEETCEPREEVRDICRS